MRHQLHLWSFGGLLSSCLLASGAPASLEARAAPECKALSEGGPVWVTADCIDPLYMAPIIDSETDHGAPLPHRRVTGHFEGTQTKFSIYLPPKEVWESRFFQIVYPLQTHEAADGDIGFALYSNSYFVQSTGQGGYRSDAAAAKFAKEVAREFYGSEGRINGYVFGGSGGSFVTIGAIESTGGVWDGAVPVVQAVPVSNPNSLAVRGLSDLVLEPKKKQIADAVMPGGSGNPWVELNEIESAVLTEVTKFGIPLPAFEDWNAVTHHNITRVMGSAIRAFDPTYIPDFWSKPGYLGTEDSPLGDFIRAARISLRGTIKSIQPAPWLSRVELSLDTDFNKNGLFEINLADGTLIAAEFDASGVALIDTPTGVVPAALTVGAEFEINNDYFLALSTLHRHQVPREPGSAGFDQFLGPDGKPLYPQRPMEIGTQIARGTAGGASFSGNITGKIICVNNIVDSEAFPMHADWYSHQAKEALGNRYADNYRLWYQDHGDHYMGPIEPRKESHLVDFSGVYHQALRDLSDWVEKGTEPPATTGYEVKDGQVVLAPRAEDRKGVQPVANFIKERYEALAGEKITLEAVIELPPGSGPVVAVDWDTRGTGKFVKGEWETEGSEIRVKRDFRFCTEGVYFPNVRVTTQRNGHTDSPYIRIYALGRTRVVVE